MKSYLFLILFLLTVFCTGISAQIEKKKAYGILLDNTGSLRTQLNGVKGAGSAIMEKITQDGEVLLFNFEKLTDRTEISPNGSWSQDKNLLIDKITRLEVVAGQTTLFDAIFSAAGVVGSKVEQEPEKFSEKILILITDGEDRSSKIRQGELIKKLKENKIKVYAVGFTEELESEGGFTTLPKKTQAENFLKKLTKETEGRVVFPKSKQKIEEIIKDLFTENTK